MNILLDENKVIIAVNVEPIEVTDNHHGVVINGETSYFMRDVTTAVSNVTLPDGVGVWTHTYDNGEFIAIPVETPPEPAP